MAGLAYLTAEGYKYRSLTYSNILLNTGSDIKISRYIVCITSDILADTITANQYYCIKIILLKGTPRDIQALSPITIELIQKYIKEDSTISIDNLLHWNSNSDTLTFLSVIISAASIAELLQVYYSLSY